MGLQTVRIFLQQARNKMNKNLQGIMEKYNSNQSAHTEPAYFNRPAKILSICKKYNIKSIFDSGCKDRTWIKDNLFAENGIEYTGGDISLPQVERCWQLFPGINIIHHDCTSDLFPSVDMVLSSDVAIHLNNDDKLKFIENFISSNVPYLLVTDSGNDSAKNIDTIYSEFPMAHINWQLEPWNFPAEIDSISDSDKFNDKRLKLWHRDQILSVIEKINI